MFSEEKQRIGNLLNDDNFATVTEYSCKNNVTPDVGLNQIISEWAGGGKIGRLKATDESTILSEIQERLGKVEKFLSQFEFVPNNVVWDYEE